MCGWYKFICEKRRLFLGVAYVIFLFTSITVFSQDRCGIVQYDSLRKQRKLTKEDAIKFEQWISSRKTVSQGRINALNTFKIPVVVHVIHNGEAVGTGVNISDVQIASQIKVLNNDFRRLNADTVNTPTEFSSLASGLDIEFILARQSPQGTATNGIVRKKGSKAQWSVNDNDALKATSYWPAEDYLNIWVTDISSTILGYAQFPISDLAGLEDAENNRLTDGVVLDYRIVGSKDDGSFNLTTTFNKGRTATHEVGHFFGLRHIWGDDDGMCNGSGDYVSDTPNQGNSTNGCPSHPQSSCSATTMFQNYMDYTNDVCMNLYTTKQVERMITVIENSPRRASLLTSKGLVDPSPVANDLALVEISNPSTSECNGPVVPTLVVENKGTNKITSSRIQLTLNGQIVETRDFTLQLERAASSTISFNSLDLSSGSNSLSFEILKTNLAADGKTNDNQKAVTSIVPALITSPFYENFASVPSTWTITNQDEGITWSLTQTAGTNTAMYLNFFNEENEDGEKDIITTPVVDLSQATSPYLTFDVAYAKNGNYQDGLEVHVLLNCKNTLSTSSKVYSKYGSSLATTSSTTSFTPLATNWRREVIDLSPYIGETNVQFAFVAVNDNGNNLYIDNVAFSKDVNENIAVKEILNLSAVRCGSSATPSLVVENRGSSDVRSFKILYAVNGGVAQEQLVSDSTLSPGQRRVIALPVVTLEDGENSFSCELIYPNGFVDVDNEDNSAQIKSVVNTSEDVIPLRKNFDNDASTSAWHTVNPQGTKNWEQASTNYGQSLRFKGYGNGEQSEDQSWFVTPVLDFSNARKASVFFDLSFYHGDMDSIKDPGSVVFQVLASRDCGETYDEILFSSSEQAISSGETVGEWIPSESSDWDRMYINLNSLTGEENVRIAFVIASTVSNNVYLDNIEFFLSDDPSPFSPSDLYKVYGGETSGVKNFYITFNLENRQSVKYELVDMLGRVVKNKELDDVLNQTYEVDVADASKGIYLVRLQIDEEYYVSRIFIGQ
jgi:hypothetical protein